MTERRRLVLRAERLTDLTNDDLRDVAGGVSRLACVATVPVVNCAITDLGVTLCGCLTDLCTLDVC